MRGREEGVLFREGGWLKKSWGFRFFELCCFVVVVFCGDEPKERLPNQSVFFGVMNQGNGGGKGKGFLFDNDSTIFR